MDKISLYSHINKTIPFIELFSKALSFISVILITRMLSVEDFGVYYYIVNIVAWASVFMDGGVSYFIINKSVKDELENLGNYMNNRVVFSLITITILCAVFVVIKLDYVIYVLIYSISFLFILLTAFFKIVSRTQGEIKIDVLSIILEPLIRVILLSVLYFSISKAHLGTIFSILLLSGFMAFSLSYHFFKTKFPLKTGLDFSMPNMYTTLYETKSYLLMYLSLVGLKRIEIIITNFKFGEYYSGLYSSADNFYNSAYLFFTSLILVGLKNQYKLRAKQKLKNFYFMAALCITSVLLIYWLSDIIYSFFYSQRYIEGAEILSIISLSLLFTPFTYFFILNNNHKNKVNNNILILSIAFLLKIVLLMFAEDIFFFSYVVVVIDFMILIAYSSNYLRKRGFKNEALA